MWGAYFCVDAYYPDFAVNVYTLDFSDLTVNSFVVVMDNKNKT